MSTSGNSIVSNSVKKKREKEIEWKWQNGDKSGEIKCYAKIIKCHFEVDAIQFLCSHAEQKCKSKIAFVLIFHCFCTLFCIQFNVPYDQTVHFVSCMQVYVCDKERDFIYSHEKKFKISHSKIVKIS